MKISVIGKYAKRKYAYPPPLWCSMQLISLVGGLGEGKVRSPRKSLSPWTVNLTGSVPVFGFWRWGVEAPPPRLCLSFRLNWAPPTPSPGSECVPPPLGS
jgi:hypothetical protein